ALHFAEGHLHRPGEGASKDQPIAHRSQPMAAATTLGHPGLFWPPRQGTKLYPWARAPPTSLAPALSSTLNAPRPHRLSSARVSFALLVSFGFRRAGSS